MEFSISHERRRQLSTNPLMVIFLSDAAARMRFASSAAQ
jgi:hypothetical protein